MKRIFLLFGVVALACSMQARSLTLDVASPLNPASPVYDANGVWDGVYNEEDFATIDFQGMSFFHNAWADYNFWYGFALASCADTAYETMADQFRCVAGGGLAGKGTPYILAYAAEGMSAYSPCEIYFSDEAWLAEEVYLCIGSWALHNVTVGGAGHTFAAGDSLVIEIEGLDQFGEAYVDNKVSFFLADYRSENEEDWTLNKGWEKCDLSALGEVYGLRFTMKTSDVGEWGSNTALYFALDGLKISRPEKVATFEDITLAQADTVWQGADNPQIGWNYWTSGDYHFQSYYGGNSGYGDYFSAFTVSNQTANTFEGLQDAYHSASGGAYKGENFAVWNMCYYGNDVITMDEAHVVPGMFVNNTAYAVNSMCNGDGYAKKFGKDDWFKLTVNGYLNGQGIDAQVDFYLAADGEYVNQWTWVDLSVFGPVDELTITMSSSDASEWGMNTPAYFALDNFGAAKPEGYVEPDRAKFPGEQAIDNTEDGKKAIKVIRDGQIIIIRDGKTFNILGAQF